MYTKKVNSNLIKLINLLNDGCYHSGDEIGEKLNITRGAVWKMTEKLTDYDIAIHSIKGKGYALSEPLQLLDSKKIKSLLNDDIKKLINIDILETTLSTNEYLKSICKTKPYTVASAEQQTQGKGRLGRRWHSPFGQNIYFSCHYCLRKDVSKLAGLSLVIALATIRALKEYQPECHFIVKWPNDILLNTKKLAGILVEISAEAHGSADVIIGIGINCNMLNADTHAIDQAWTSLRQESGKLADRNILTAKLLTYLIHYIQQFESAGLTYFKEEWKANDYLVGKSITIVNGNNQELTGIANGIDDQGHLLLKLNNGNVQAFSSGDVSLRKASLTF